MRLTPSSMKNSALSSSTIQTWLSWGPRSWTWRTSGIRTGRCYLYHLNWLSNIYGFGIGSMCRTYEGLQEYGEPMARTSEMMDVRRCLEANPLLSGKIRYRIPNANGGRGPADLVLPPPPLPAVMRVLPPPLPAAPAASPAGPEPLPLIVLRCGPGYFMLVPRGFI